MKRTTRTDHIQSAELRAEIRRQDEQNHAELEICGECGSAFVAIEGQGEWAHSIAYGFVCGKCLRREEEEQQADAEQIEDVRRAFDE